MKGLGLEQMASCFQGLVPAMFFTCAKDGTPNAAFLSHVPVPPQNVHPVETDGVTLDEAARRYELALEGLVAHRA